MISRLHQQDLLLARIQREVGEDVGIKGLGTVAVEDPFIQIVASSRQPIVADDEM